MAIAEARANAAVSIPTSAEAVRTDRTSSDELSAQRRLVEALRRPEAYSHTVDEVTLLETHISFVLLTGRYAYKIKKAVDYEFLDFTTLARRRFYCKEELRLNRLLAPQMYLDVVAITGSIQAPRMDGEGVALDYAVRMRQFDQDALLSRLIDRDALIGEHIDSLALVVASFHGQATRALETARFGAPDEVMKPARQNFDQMLAVMTDSNDRCDLEDLRSWTEKEYMRCAALLSKRRRGFIRECHGDLHLNNIALIDGEVTLFDRIEFNESMRWIDVMSDVAFLVMDLRERGRPDLGARFLNRYLEITGDYEGVGLIPFYLTYRAMVRAKIACLRMNQVVTADSRAALRDEYRQYGRLAKSHGLGHPAIVLMHGLAGSGKTTASEHLLQRIGAIRLRTDIERKRIHGLDAEARTDSPIARGIYTDADTQRVYERICVLAGAIAEAGYVAIADGAFLRRWERDLFRNAAVRLNVPFIIIDCTAPLHTLRRRVAERLTGHHDPSEATIAVLEAQMAVQEPLAPDERPAVAASEDEFIGWFDRQYPARPSGAATLPRWILKSTMKYATARGAATNHQASAVRRLASGTTLL